MAHCAFQTRHRGHHNLERAGSGGDPGQCVAEDLGHAADLAAAATGQHQEQRRIGKPPPRLLRIRPQLADPLAERMADEIGRRAAEPLHRLRLERQQRQHPVDVRTHGAGAPRAPGPHRWADIIDDANLRRARAHPARHAMGEFRAVDDDQHVGLGGNDRVGRLGNALENFRQAHGDGGKADNGQIAKREQRRHARGRHMLAADAGQAHVWVGATQSGDQ